MQRLKRKPRIRGNIDLAPSVINVVRCTELSNGGPGLRSLSLVVRLDDDALRLSINVADIPTLIADLLEGQEWTWGEER